MNKRRSNLFMISCLLIFGSIKAQIAQNEISSTTYIKKYGKKGESRGVTVEQTSDLGFIITGNTTDGDHGGEDVLLMKTDAQGNVVWRRTYGGSGDDSGWAVRQCSDRGYIVCGFTNSFGAGGMDVYLIRTDEMGEVRWTKTIGDAGDEFGWDIQSTNDDGFIIASQTNSQGNGEVDAYIIRTNSDGTVQWSFTYGGDQADRIFAIQSQQDGGYIAAGITYSYQSTGPNDRDGYVLKVDAEGNKVWHKVIGGDRYDVIHALSATNDQGYILIGYGESNAENGGTDLYLIKENEDGKTLWQQVYGESYSERGIKGVQTKDQGIIAIGFTENKNNLLLVRTDRYGKEQWTRSYGAADTEDFGYTVKQTADAGFILVGHSADSSGGNSRVLLIKTDENGNVNK